MIQVAKYLGAYVATTAHTKDINKLTELGADEVIDYPAADFAEVLSGYDIVLDSLGTASLEKSLTILKPGGLAISVVDPPDPAFAAQLGKSLLKPVMALLSRKVRSRARKLGVRYSFFFMQANGAQLAKLAALYDDGTLRPVLDRTWRSALARRCRSSPPSCCSPWCGADTIRSSNAADSRHQRRWLPFAGHRGAGPGAGPAR